MINIYTLFYIILTLLDIFQLGNLARRPSNQEYGEMHYDVKSVIEIKLLKYYNLNAKLILQLCLNIMFN